MPSLYCRWCDYNPCMCGRRDYHTEDERRRLERKEHEERWKEDAWALPDYGEREPEPEEER